MPVHDATGGPVAGVFPLELIDQVIEQAQAGQRRRRLLPAASVMIFVLGCALFYGDSYGEVARKVQRWLVPLAGPGGWRVPGTAALARARRRLGPRPFELLFAALRGPLADPALPGVSAFGRDLMLMSVDGTSLDLPATASVIAAYGPPPSGSGGPGGYPQLRLLTLVACGTRGIADAVFGPRKTSEQDLARQIAGRGALGPGMLVLADRNFCHHKVIAALAATGADLLIRAKAGQILPVLEALPDGSARAVLPDPAATARRRSRNKKRRRRHSPLPPDPPVTDGIAVRLIEADITTSTGGQDRTERYRLITTLLDCRTAPADAIAALYHQRWETETTYAHLKTTLRGPGRILRSRDQAGIEQETWALLCAHQILTATRTRAAATARLDPDRASYTVTLRALRRHITTPGHTPADTTTEILTQLNPPRRRPRSYPRLTSTSTAKRRTARPPTPHTTCTITITPPAPDP